MKVEVSFQADAESFSEMMIALDEFVRGKLGEGGEILTELLEMLDGATRFEVEPGCEEESA